MPRVLLEDIEIDVVTSENPDYNNEITERPVETGQDVADHARNLPIIFGFTGVVVAPNAAQKLSQLRRYRDNKQILTYVGRNIIRNVMIQRLSTTHTKTNREGFGFTITLKQVGIAKSKTVTITVPDPARASSTQVAPIVNKGSQQQGQKPADETTRQSLLLKATSSATTYFAKVGL